MSQTEVQLIKNGAVVDADINGMSSSKLSGALPAISGASLTNLPSTGKAKNLIINGSMKVAQRGTSTTSDGYKFIDRWQTSAGNIGGVTVTRSQQSISSSDTGPYEAGFRKYARVALGAAGTAAANSYLDFYQHIEAQNLANSGWDYTSASSYITISFWLRCSTNQTFYLFLRSRDGTNQSYVTPITASANNTWTKITKTIPGNSSLQFDDDSGSGLTLSFFIYNGTDATSSSKTINAWAARVSGADSPDMATTWLTAGASTFDVTGVQLEVGSNATDFEHRLFAEEKVLCQRYCYQWDPDHQLGLGQVYSGQGYIMLPVALPVEMRAKPSVTKNGSYWFVSYHGNSGYAGDRTVTISGNNGTVPNGFMYRLFVNGGSNQGNATTVWCIMHDSADQYLRLEAEL